MQSGEQRDEVRDASTRKIEIVDPRSTALAPPHASLPHPDLAKSAGARDEISRLGIGKDALLKGDDVLVHQFAGPLELPSVGGEPSRFDELALHGYILLSSIARGKGLC